MSVYVLDELERSGLLPIAVVSTPDKPKGRKLILTPTPVKAWAIERNITVFDPAKLDDELIKTLQTPEYKADVYVVASFGKIIPANIINIPTRGTLNIHPSMLPKYRGASPLQSAILDDSKDTGVSIMKIDELMDHGPIVTQAPIHIDEWPTYEVFEEMMARVGGKLLVEVLPAWIAGSMEAKEQDHSQATHCKKIIKEDGEIHLTEEPYLNFRKIQAYHQWPQAYFFIEHESNKKMRIKVNSASFKDGQLIIEKVTPEGSKEMSHEDFLRGYNK